MFYQVPKRIIVRDGKSMSRCGLRKPQLRRRVQSGPSYHVRPDPRNARPGFPNRILDNLLICRAFNEIGPVGAGLLEICFA